ncbi:GAG-pre-integrase domain-containing protein, partial [Herbaspirillum sp.]|uniref:GAG-pre-integrase domain-containing protein n=1 Tax=Herbaspirillum sp. TaxID=1890675 RepID=UPI00338F8DC8
MDEEDDDDVEDPPTSLVVSNKYHLDHSADSWHRRLGHCPTVTLRKLAKEGLKITGPAGPITLSWCDACHFGKQHRQAFSGASTPSSRKLERVFWGPSRFPSIAGGYRYYIVFVDDYSDFKVVRFLVTRGEATQAVIDYHCFWSSRFRLSLRYLRS